MGSDREIAEDGVIDECMRVSIPSSGLGVIEVIRYEL